MKEQILKILIKHRKKELKTSELVKLNAVAQDISDMYKEFIAWLLNDPDEPNGTLNDLFEHWFNNIYKK